MRVLIVSWEYPPHINGGLGRHVAELVPALVQAGVEIHVVTPTFGPVTDQLERQVPQKPNGAESVAEMPAQTSTVSVEEGIVVHRVFVPYNETLFDIYIRAIRVNHLLEAYVQQVAGQFGPWDLIHTHDWLTAFAGIALKRALNCPLVTTIHATERGRLRGHLANHLQQAIDNIEHIVVHEADRVIVCSHHMFNELQSFFQVSVSKLAIVPNGVDISGLNNNHHKDLRAFRAKFAAPYEQIVFTIARLVHEKGLHRLIEATPRILDTCPSAQIIVAGKGPEAQNLEQQAKDLDVTHQINFVGFISDEDRNYLFKVADCAIFPSLYEPFGIVALEAMALGCPVVVSDVGGFAEVVTHTETGITTYADNYESVAWGVLQALTHPDLAQKYATNAKKSVKEQFAWSRIATLTHNVYQQALNLQHNIDKST